MSRINAAYSSHLQRTGQVWDCSQSAILFPKHIVIIPLTGEFHSNFHEYDEHVTTLKYIPDTGKPVKVDYSLDMPGNPGKPYHSCLSTVTVHNRVRQRLLAVYIINLLNCRFNYRRNPCLHVVLSCRPTFTGICFFG